MNLKPKKEFRDPIHGIIPIYEEEFEIIQDPVFQRLRRVKQLSFAYLVYHGAEHSRFGHVIGVMHLVEKALNKIKENSAKLGRSITIPDEDIRLARIAALLHDVGHHPFSHALDKTDMIPADHENYSTTLVESRFSTIIEKAKLKPEEVNKLILGKPHPEKSFISELIHSQIDMDRCDYLLRDSHYCGVKYGIYDLDRLLDSLFVTDEKQLVVLNKGIFAVEQFILARHYMFSQIYLHKTKRCLETLAKVACEYLYRKKQFVYPAPSELKEPSNIDDFISLDDAWFLKKITEIKEPNMQNIVNAIKLRIPYPIILDSEIQELKMQKKGEKEDGNSYLKGVEESLKHDLETTDNLKKIGIEKEDIIFDEAKKLSYKLRPYPTPSLIKEEDPRTIYIYDDETGSKEPMENRSKLIPILGETIKIRRTYVLKIKKDVLWKYLSERHKGLN